MTGPTIGAGAKGAMAPPVARLRARWDAVVFDLDGTLVDSAGEIQAITNTLLGRHNRRQISRTEVIPMIGDGSPMLLHRAFAATGEPLTPERHAELLPEFLEIYSNHPADPDQVYPGVRETLGLLKDGGVRLGLCTNKPGQATAALLATLELDGVFDAVLGGDALDVRKPDPGHVRGVADRLEAPPARAVMVGDNANDVAAGRGAGLLTVAVSYGYPRMPIADLGADLVIDAMEDLVATLVRHADAGGGAA